MLNFDKKTLDKLASCCNLHAYLHTRRIKSCHISHVLTLLYSLCPALFTRFYFSAHAVINFPFNVERGTCPSFIYAFKQKINKKEKAKKRKRQPQSGIQYTNRDSARLLCSPAPSLLPAAIPPCSSAFLLVGKKFISQHFH